MRNAAERRIDFISSFLTKQRITPLRLVRNPSPRRLHLPQIWAVKPCLVMGWVQKTAEVLSLHLSVRVIINVLLDIVIISVFPYILVFSIFRQLPELALDGFKQLLRVLS